MASKGMNLQLDDETREKLEALSRKSGKTKTAVIRQLILGRSLGDRTGKQVLARLNQLGNLLRHCASILKDRGEGVSDFVAIGTEIREIALKLSIKDGNDESADSGL